MNEPKIMAIDDDVEMLKQLAIMLKDQYAVSVMTSAEQALAALSEGNLPDLILLDVMMPDTDGFSLMEHLKNDKELRKIPVIFLTGMTNTDDEIRGLTIGGADYIRKPFHREVLLVRIALQLASRTLRSEEISDEIASQLTDNERKVAELLRQGYSGKEIGEKLFFSYSYIKRIIASLKLKLDVEGTTELIRKLRENH
jgi:Response regulator containing a CheY-like receiver domain and an HTH DNA-binding domain